MKILTSINLIIIIIAFSYGTSLSRTIINPRISISEAYDDNIYLYSEEEEDDFITTLTPGLSVDLDTKLAKFNLDYALQFKSYQQHSEENQTSFRDAQRATLDVLIFPERSLTVKLREVISRVDVDARDAVITENDLVNKVTLYRFIANPEYLLTFSPVFRAVAGYQFESLDYVVEEGNDANIHNYTLALIRDLAADSTVRADLFYQDYRSDSNDDFQQERATVGLTMPFGPYWRADLAGGVGRATFESLPETKVPVWSANIEGNLTKNLILTLTTDRNYIVSVNDGLIRRDQASVASHILGEMDIQIKVYAKEDVFQAVDRTDRSLGSELRSLIPLSKKLSFIVHGNISANEFLPGDERTLRYGAGSALQHVGKNMSLSLEYSMGVNDSNQNERDYVSNITMLTAGMRF